MGSRSVLLLVLLAGCAPERPTRDSTAKSGGPGDSESNTDSDTGVGDTDTAVTDSDSGGGGGDTDTGGGDSDDSAGLDLGVDAAAKLIGKDATSSHFGMTLDGGRDVTGDGVPDIVVSQSSAEAELVPYSGVVYVYAGEPKGVVRLDELATTLWGAENTEIGSTIALAGDIDGDGVGDLAVGAPYWDDSTDQGGTPGALFVVYGPIDSSGEIGGNATMIEGEHRFEGSGTGNAFGWGLAAVGDTNADGFDDLLVSAFEYDDFGRDYLFTGPLTGALDAGTDATAWIDGVPGEHAADRVVAGAGDVDGDGLPDLLLSHAVSGASGAVLFLSPVVGSLTIADGDAELNDSSGSSAGTDVASAGDVDGDGYADVVLGATRMGDAYLGGAYLVAGPVTGTFDLAGAAAVLVGTQVDGVAGAAVASAGDINADGFDDVLVGGPDTAFEGPGTTYVVFGPAVGTLPLAEADVVIHGEGGDDQSGWPVAAAGDVDGDGLDDILIGGPGDDDGGEDAGAVWLVLGAAMR